MFCPKCGAKVDDGTVICPNCGLDFSSVNSSSETPSAGNPSVGAAAQQVPATKNVTLDYSIIRFVYFGLAAIVLIMFFMAASKIISGGNEIMQIQSVGGKTLEEAYYFELGSIYAGYAMISRALGIFFSSVLVWCGLKLR